MYTAFLPDIFLQQMRELLLPGEFDAFCETYEQPTVRGLRLNKLKPQSVAFDFNTLATVPWCAEGLYYNEETRPSKSIFHHAGLFYIQEPSAMCPVEVLKPMPGDRVLDLCAAPGGKSAQIAGHMMGAGLLVSNDASPTRSRALVKNLERLGVTNAVVTTELPKKLTGRFPEFFDKILVDAPCSGEGMFRRDADAVKAYTANKPDACVEMQTDILRYAARMLKPGGRLVYSTCTFNMKENENVIAWFLENNPEFCAVAIEHERLGISAGLGALSEAGRIFPHRAVGEGHFVALLEKKLHGEPRTEVVGAPFIAPGYLSEDIRKSDTNIPMEIAGQVRNGGAGQSGGYGKDENRGNSGRGKQRPYKEGARSALSPAHSLRPASRNLTPTLSNEFAEFCKTHITGVNFPPEKIIAHGANLYLSPEPLDLSGIRTARSGWFLGEVSKGRFIPSHALAMGLRREDVSHGVELSEENAHRYLRGESFEADETLQNDKSKPWVMVCYHGYPLGWARLVQGRLKNNLPVGLVIK